MEIMRCHRLGPQRGKDRPIVANFLKHTDKETIRRSSSVLRSTKFGVSDQFPPEISRRRRILVPYMKQLQRQHGPKAASLQVDKLYCGDAVYVVQGDNIIELPGRKKDSRPAGHPHHQQQQQQQLYQQQQTQVIRDCLQNVTSQNIRPTSQSSADPNINNIDPYPGHGPRVNSSSLPNRPPTNRPQVENSRGVPTSNRFASLSNEDYPNPDSVDQWPGLAPPTRSADQSTINVPNSVFNTTGVNRNNPTNNTAI